MKTLTELYRESIIPEKVDIPDIVLVMRLLNNKNHVIIYTEDEGKSYKSLIYDLNNFTEATLFKNEINEYIKWLHRFNGDGIKVANQLDRLNDLHELKENEITKLNWFKNWWDRTGKINQKWLPY